MASPEARPTASPWPTSARRLGIISAVSLLAVGILYVAVIAFWLLNERTPREPIGDPYLAYMELLTIASAFGLFGYVVALWVITASRRVPALVALILGTVAAVLTTAVHFVQLTAVRQLWRVGRLTDYRLIWPSPLFAVEYFVWDVLIGFTMVASGLALDRTPGAFAASRALLIGGALCLLGSTGPISGHMQWQNVAVLGYALVLPIAAGFTARLLLRAGASPFDATA